MYKYNIGNLLDGSFEYMEAENFRHAIVLAILRDGHSLTDFYVSRTRYGYYLISTKDDRLVYGAWVRQVQRIG